MTRVLAVLVLAAALAATVAALAQTAPRPAPGPAPGAPAAPVASSPPPAAGGTAPHADPELDCRNCHVGNHRGVVQMYVGMGGRGTPMIPSHMFQVRVECVACHVAPKVEDAAAGLVGQTFRPSEQACVRCHGEKYRGMLQAWNGTLTRMRETVEPKVAAARAALAAADPKSPKHARARKLVDDAEYNTRFVALARGVHNVFYAADLLKLANGWVDEAMPLLGKTPAKTDDQLVRGGYCAVLCHQAAGVKQREVVTFSGRRLPHVRHVAEFGATCTSCHSAETHKAVTATAATCAGCHHSPHNERCESCHRAQSDFYRGRAQAAGVKAAPNVMADAVGCTGCHDWSRKPTREALGQACLGCHETPYLALLREWTTGYGADVKRAADAVRAAEAAVARARRAGGVATEAESLLREAREALALVRRSGVAHNPLAADALLTTARDRAEQARTRATR
jgi:hypothetical protein